MIHGVHRWLGWVVAILGLILARVVWVSAQTNRAKSMALWLGGVVIAQFCLGAWTVLSSVSLWVAISHQVLGFGLVSVTVALLHALKRED